MYGNDRYKSIFDKKPGLFNRTRRPLKRINGELIDITFERALGWMTGAKPKCPLNILLATGINLSSLLGVTNSWET